MLISLVLWACASKSVPAEVEDPALDAKAGTSMVPEAAEAAPARRASVKMPGDEVVVRQCYAGSRGGRAYSPPPAAKSSSGRSAGQSPSPTPRPTTTASAPPPAPVSAPSGTAGVGSTSKSVSTGDAGGAGTLAYSGPSPADEVAMPAPQKAKKAPAAPPAEPAMPDAEEATAVAWAGEAELDDADDSADKPMAGAEKKDSSERARREESRGKGGYRMNEPKPRDPSFDWGGVTYLSNDDSMSLASAQRLLWAVQNKGPVKTREVRPHELLNYFSFDTVDVAPGETFSVLGQAVAAEPGKLTLALAVKGTTPPRRSLDLTYVLDRSGSMWDEGRMDYLKRGLTKMKDQLQRGDRVDVVLFDHELCTPLENYVVGRDDPEFLDDVIAKLQPRGATNLDIGLKEAYRITTARTDGAGRNRRMLLVTDALLNEGEIDPDVLAGISSGFTDHGIRLSTIGVGRSFDDKVLDAISERGKGAYVYLGSEAVVDRVFGAGFRSLTETIAHDVRFGLDLPDSLAMERFYGEEASTVKSDVQPIDYYAGTTQLFLQDVAMRDNTPALADRLVLTIEWTDPVSGERKSTQKGMTLGELVAGEVRNVKKGRALMAWTDLILARSLGADPCDTPYDTWADRVRVLGPDAEVSWLDGLTSPLCGKPPVADTLTVAAGVPFKVKLDADQTIPELGLSCAGQQEVKALSGNVAVFSAQPGVCELRVVGVVPMFASVKVPAGGGDVRCVLRGGRLSCG